jgi:hypothetical protein
MAGFWHGLEIGVVIGAAMVALPVSRALTEPGWRPGFTWKRAKWRRL